MNNKERHNYYAKQRGINPSEANLGCKLTPAQLRRTVKKQKREFKILMENSRKTVEEYDSRYSQYFNTQS